MLQPVMIQNSLDEGHLHLVPEPVPSSGSPEHPQRSDPAGAVPLVLHRGDPARLRQVMNQAFTILLPPQTDIHQMNELQVWSLDGEWIHPTACMT